MKGLNETMQFRPTRALIDLEALRHNFQLARSLAGAGRPLMAIIKANAYGHGAVQAGWVLEAAGAEAFGVATPREGIELRESGIKAPIFLMAGPMEAPGDLLQKYRFTPVIFQEEQLHRLQDTLTGTLEFHLKVDTGMTRLGVLPQNLENFLIGLKKYSRLKLSGVLTHLARADETFEGPTEEQFKIFAEVKERVQKNFPDAAVFHIANSAAILGGRVGPNDWARPGIMLYGSNPHPRFESGRKLRPVMTLETEVLSLKEVPKGAAVSYGGEWIAPRPSRIAVLPIGYADGYLRSLSNRGQVSMEGRRYPVVGRVCMDLTMIDVTEAPSVKVGSKVLLWGSGLPVEEVAQAAGTISYELLCSVSQRVPRIYRGGK